ncbi:MAG: cytochrome b/b6 domain-containing protein [Candidatus Zixiibacteriota bacterium]|nr:MAG: cytochrome b/b6 domain-containing protein [candidate division Zixibacteria bacterium]
MTASNSNSDHVLREALRRALREKMQARGVPDSELSDARLDEMISGLDVNLDQQAERLAAQVRPAPVPQPAPPVKMPKEEPEEFVRLSLNLRLQHVTMLTSIIALIITGLPLKFHEAGLSHFVINLLGGIESSAIIHRIAATALAFVGVFHVVYTILSKAGRRDFLLLLPKLQDALDYVQQLKYYLGKSDQKPRFGRFSYIEKFDYWAVYWGMIIMIGSGSLLWFESVTMQFLPKFFLDIAKEAHSDEALLATLAIIIWHFYNVHLNPHKFPMSKTWITGKISKEEMLDEHPLEYEEIMQRKNQESSGQSQRKASRGGRS